MISEIDVSAIVVKSIRYRSATQQDLQNYGLE
jgi:hypothetical protein